MLLQNAPGDRSLVGGNLLDVLEGKVSVAKVLQFV